jgi:hypothetical protein
MLLLEIAILCGLRGENGNNLYVPLCLAILIPVSSVSTYLGHRSYVLYMLKNNIIAGDFTL